MKTAIVTDSNSGISQAEAEQLGIFVLPMPFIAGEEVYHEGKNLTPERFYELLQSDTVLRTSQPSPGEMAALWDRVLEDYEELLFIPMSSGLSASYASACLLAEDYDGRVVVADAHRISITMRHSIRDALAMREAGLSAQEMKEEIEKLAFLSIVYVGVEDLKYLKRGGRISGAVATVGSILNIKPLLVIKGEKVEPFATVRGTKHCKKREVEEMVKAAAEFRAEGRKIWVGQTGSFLETADVADWQALGQAAFPEETVTYDPLSYSVACHTGPNAFGMGVSVRWEPGMRN